MEDMDTFGQRLQSACARIGKTHYQVAIEIGFPQGSMSLIANDKKRPKPEHLRQIASHPGLGVTYEELASWASKSAYEVDHWPYEIDLDDLPGSFRRLREALGSEQFEKAWNAALALDKKASKKGA